ncbi:uncharacterized protein N7479_007943 [Penicillium vulpinum]|uniref:Beta-xylosidase C-terminal Concanavalin A-like domain-containing protein n=1 Tax=Penicillium vulpinum TaxID=29845 RepID=A0A1V6RMA0_9EURO|nr:uncharacterized protein N7479_007943 [Penicillium vulpinum]KAJ5960793.1 hypothetical protein N7479_007943 [Penicillium vulpinum]OQE02678.1 hypothetical protein PENVUL_c039G00736 [Penicillium vulpinum]
MLSPLIIGIAALAGIGFCDTTLTQQPILWEDLADLDVFRVNDTFYYSASTMHYSPGAPILSSKDLVNWEYIGHSVPSLDWGSKYSLEDGGSAYVKGVFASTLRVRPSDGRWFWVGCVEYSKTYIYTAPSAKGPWTQLVEFSDKCYYDCGLLFDDDGTPYVAFGGTNIEVAQLSTDLKSQVSSEVVHTYDVYAEGSRLYKVDETYYILNVDPSTAIEYVLKSSSIWGPYESAILANAPSCPSEVGGRAHQGGIVDDPNGNWYYMAFCDSYPGGRVPVLAPIEFPSSGFPRLPDLNSWPKSVTVPLATVPQKSLSYTDSFSGTSLSPQWEWNHNPNTNAYSVNNKLILHTATVTNDLYHAQNTLTHRALGPSSAATIKLDISDMHSGDRAGLAIFRDLSAWVGIINNGDNKVVGVWTDLKMTIADGSWSTVDVGSLEASENIGSSGSIYLRAHGNFSPTSDLAVQFSYSTNGHSFTNIGSVFTMGTKWEFFMGHRYGIFNFATKSLGGKVTVSSFTMEAV